MRIDEISRIVKYHRKQSGLSREKLANLAGVGKTVVYDIEKGKETIQLKSLLNVLEALNISLKLDTPFNKKSEDEE
ncbi:MAG: transcriptional regulator [Gammaproteobacteria bacterium]|jgi:y4mF family transcriptional regulator|nr:transcriptional regulator [Gammaproteobacteria bacterium]MCE3238199.1 transcriptional regulator [Gammaproteobacteria bacterium]